MEPAPGLLEGLPTWGELLRLWPISLHAVALIALGWWARGKVDQAFIDYLKRRAGGPPDPG